MNGLYFIHFFLGLAASFVGTLPFGTINLSVVSTTINQSFRAGFTVSVAAAMVEILQSYLAFHFSMWITVHIEQNTALRVALMLVFFAIGVYFLLRKSPGASSDRFRLPNFLKGIILGLVNPQALPFWVFVIAYFQAAHLIAIDGMHMQLGLLLTFLIGVSIGKLGALTLYGALSVVVVRRVSSLSTWMNKFLGVLFLLLALVQAVRLF